MYERIENTCFDIHASVQNQNEGNNFQEEF